MHLYRQLESFETTALARNVDLGTYICTLATLFCLNKALQHRLGDLGVRPKFRFEDICNDPRELVIYSN